MIPCSPYLLMRLRSEEEVRQLREDQRIEAIQRQMELPWELWDTKSEMYPDDNDQQISPALSR